MGTRRMFPSGRLDRHRKLGLRRRGGGPNLRDVISAYKPTAFVKK
jgi:hypothetical protein